MRRIAISAILCGLIGSACGQRAVTAPTGVVTGHVLLEDTQRPGRLVTVSLVRRPDEKITGSAKAKEPVSQQMISTRTGLDGGFTFLSVPLGDYWVVAQSEGYVLPFADVATEAEQKSPANIMIDFPAVVVTAERPAEASLSLRRGGVVSGHMRFDDGAAVSGVTLTLMPVGKLRGGDSHGVMAIGQISRAHEFKTNDAGAFRISGVAPGKYYLEAIMQVYGGATVMGNRNFYTMGGGNQIWMHFYPPGTIHKAASSVLDIRSSEEIGDADITVNLSSMHSVAGRVVSREDQHTLNEGIVNLKDPGDKDLSYRSIVSSDGRFFFPYVPEGNFELSFESAADAAEPTDPANPWNRKTLQSYADQRVPLIVGNQDVNVADVALTTKKAAVRKTEKADE